MWDASGIRGGEPMNGAAAQRSALSHGPRKLDRSHGRRGRDVYKYYMGCMLHGRTEGTHRSSK
jgi:hypothetical protein